MDDDFQLQGYQDDLDTDPGMFDEITHEATDERYDIPIYTEEDPDELDGFGY